MDPFSGPNPAVKVLVVEDEPTLAENMSIYLAAHCGEVRLAGDGASALGLGCSFRPDVLVLDYSLPDMSGFEVLAALRSCGCASPCVLITAHPCDRVDEEVNRYGISLVLFKPFALAELIAMIHKATGGESWGGEQP